MGKPAAFPDASIGGSAKQNEDLFDQVFNEKNINTILKTAVSSGVKFVPGVGALLSGLVSALWPNPEKNKNLVWDDIEKKVETVASGLIAKNNSQGMRNRTEGIYNVMMLYLNQPAGTQKKGNRFDIMLAALEENQPCYFNDESPWLNLAYFSFMGTLHLTVLREQHLFYKDIWGEEDQGASQHQRDLETTVEKYLIARNRIVRRCLEWHRDEIKEDWHKKDSGYFNTNDLNIVDPLRNVNENFHWSENNDFVGKKKYMCRIKQLRDWVDTGYRSQIETLLSPTFSWPLYHPNPPAALSKNESGANDPLGVRQGQIDQLEPGVFTIQRLMMDYPGWIGDGVRQELTYDNKSYSSHEQLYKQHGPITKVIIYAGARIDGIEAFYGGQSSAIIGRKGGSQHEALELKPGEFITGLWANDYGDCGSVSALKLQVTTEDGHVVQTTQYGQADSWKYSFDGHEGGLKGGNTKRLLWISGWDYDDWRSGWVMRLLPTFGHYEVWGPLK
jgi:hypothetical protein